MWVEGGDIHDELLDRLGGVLAPPEELELTPTAAELDALAAAVSARWPGEAGLADPVPAAPMAGGDVRRLRWAGPRARRLGSASWRAGSVAAGIVLFSASAAAAANGGVPMPRPVRVVAYSVGLPVDSPALDDTHQHIKDLNQAVKAKDKPKAEASVRRLQTDLAKVPADEKKDAVPKVEAAIAVAATSGLIQNPTPATTTTTTTPPAASTTTVTAAPGSATTATTAEEEKEKEKEKQKPAPATSTTEPSTTTTTAPETTPSSDPGAQDPAGGTTGGTDPGSGSAGSGTNGDPGTTPTTVPAETTTTTTTAPPPEETSTTTTTTVPESTTTTTAPVAP